MQEQRRLLKFFLKQNIISSKDFIFHQYIFKTKMYKLYNEMFSKKYDRHTDKVIHRGGPLLKTFEVTQCRCQPATPYIQLVLRIRFILTWIRILLKIRAKIKKISTYVLLFFFYKKYISVKYDLFCYLWCKDLG